MSKLLSPILFFLFLLETEIQFAQTKIIVHDNSSNNNKTTTVYSKDTKKKDNAGAFSFLGTGQVALKLNATHAFRGSYCLSLEKKLTKSFSAEFTGGITWFDPVFDTHDLIGYGTKLEEIFDYRPKNYASNISKYKIGPMIKIGARYYLNSKEDEIEGGYVCLEAMFRRYNALAGGGYPSREKINEYNDHREIRALFGIQGCPGPYNEILLFDLSFGLGYRMHVRQYYGNETIQPAFVSPMTAQSNYVTYLLSLKIGFVLN